MEKDEILYYQYALSDLSQDLVDRLRLLLLKDYKHEDLCARSFCNTQYGSLAEALISASLKYHRSWGENKDKSVAHFRSHVLPDEMQILESLHESIRQSGGAIHSNNASEEIQVHYEIWRHEEHPLRAIRHEKDPYMERQDILSAVQSYLNLPYRVPSLERLLVDILLALEVFAYGYEVLPKPTGKSLMGASYFSVVLVIIRNFILRQAFIVMVYWFFAFWAAIVSRWLTTGSLDGPALEILSYNNILLYLLIFSVDFLLIPLRIYWSTESIFRLHRMNDIYQNMSLEKPVDPEFLLRQVREGEKKGIVWPEGLTELLLLKIKEGRSY